MTRPPIVSGRSFGTAPSQSGGSQYASLPRPSNSPAANVEPNGEREQIPPMIRDIRVLHPSRRNGAKWYCFLLKIHT